MDPHRDIATIADLLPGSVDASHIEFSGPEKVAASAFDVDRVLAASAAYAVAAADGAGGVERAAMSRRTIDLAHLLAYCTTHVEVDGRTVPAWADLSGVYPTVDGRHLQIHCNFAHHADGVVQRLGCAPDRESVAAAIAERSGFELEAELIEDGMIGAVVRTLDEWSQHPHSGATRDLPLVSFDRIGDARPRQETRHVGAGPLAGARVVDCSRVLAGPVAGQLLADFGADVMRVGAPHLPSVPVGVISTGFGKRNAYADVSTVEGRDAMWSLLGDADIWIDAYRPGALASHGFTPERVAEYRPGIVIVQVCAFDWVGPWAGRRGFDSIVQSTTGIRAAGGDYAVDASRMPLGLGPTGLPVQALDYATGFLAAGAASQLLAHQRDAGGSWLTRLSLLRTRNWLASMGGPHEFTPAGVTVADRFLDTVDSDFGQVTAVTPFAGSWYAPPAALGSSPPQW